jgi:hypothetical protein
VVHKLLINLSATTDTSDAANGTNSKFYNGKTVEELNIAAGLQAA